MWNLKAFNWLEKTTDSEVYFSKSFDNFLAMANFIVTEDITDFSARKVNLPKEKEGNQ